MTLLKRLHRDLDWLDLTAGAVIGAGLALITIGVTRL